jgi:hypothetical protein
LPGERIDWHHKRRRVHVVAEPRTNFLWSLQIRRIDAGRIPFSQNLAWRMIS